MFIFSLWISAPILHGLLNRTKTVLQLRYSAASVLFFFFFFSRGLLPHSSRPHLASSICDDADIKSRPLCSGICYCSYTSTLCLWGVSQGAGGFRMRWLEGRMAHLAKGKCGENMQMGQAAEVIWYLWDEWNSPPLFSSFSLSHFCD